MSGTKEWQHLKIPLSELQKATKNFETCIGKGGYGWVYKGELSISGKQTMVAVKRLNEQLGQGLKEFLTEIQLLTGQQHPNLVSLLGYCDDGKEKIIVYEYAARGSLDRYIRRSNTTYTLTWLERLKICVDAARGLDHLHSHVGEHQTIIHRDIKSANILLDVNWVGKIADLGLSRLSLAGLDRSAVISHACGTPGYCEPEYIITGVVKKESDVYSFGMVLFEVMCGRLCNVKNDDGYVLSAKLVKELYETKKLDDIIDPSLRKQMSSYSMRKFAEIAYECLQDDREERPPMDLVTKELKKSLELQEDYESNKEDKLNMSTVIEFDSEEYWSLKLPEDIEDTIAWLDDPLLVGTTRKKLFSLLRKGIFFDHGHRFFAINDDGTKCETITADTFIEGTSKSSTSSNKNTRDSRGRGPKSSLIIGKYPHNEELNVPCQIRTSMLSSGVMYSANLIFSFGSWGGSDSIRLNSSTWVWIEWQCQDMSVSFPHFAQQIEDNAWGYSKNPMFKTTLWHFINSYTNGYFDITLNKILGARGNDVPSVMIHGIDFQPVEMVKQHDGIEGVSVSDKDENVVWEKNMPFDYQRFIDRSDRHLEYTTHKELYLLLCVGILIDNGQNWFFLCKSTGVKCHTLSAIKMLSHDPNYQHLERLSLSESRFQEVVRLQDGLEYHFKFILESAMLTSYTVYACYLVFKFIDVYTTKPHEVDTCMLKALYSTAGTLRDEGYAHLKFLEPISIPTIKPTKKNIKLRDSSKIPKNEASLVPKWCIDGKQNNFMELRNDGWMEVVLFKQVSISIAIRDNPMEVNLSCVEGDLNKVIVLGIEFRPKKRHIINLEEEKFSGIIAMRKNMSL